MAKLDLHLPFDKVAEACLTNSAQLFLPATAITSGAAADVCITYSATTWPQAQVVIQRHGTSSLHGLLQFVGRFNVAVGGTTTAYTNVAFDPHGDGLHLVFDNTDTYTAAHGDTGHITVDVGMVDIANGSHILHQALAEVQYVASLHFNAHADGVTRANCLVMSSTLLKALVPDAPTVLASKAMRQRPEVKAFVDGCGWSVEKQDKFARYWDCVWLKRGPAQTLGLLSLQAALSAKKLEAEGSWVGRKDTWLRASILHTAAAGLNLLLPALGVLLILLWASAAFLLPSFATWMLGAALIKIAEEWGSSTARVVVQASIHAATTIVSGLHTAARLAARRCPWHAVPPQHVARAVLAAGWLASMTTLLLVTWGAAWLGLSMLAHLCSLVAQASCVPAVLAAWHCWYGQRPILPWSRVLLGVRKAAGALGAPLPGETSFRPAAQTQ